MVRWLRSGMEAAEPFSCDGALSRLESSGFSFGLPFFSRAGLSGRACDGALLRGMTTPWKVVWSCFRNGLKNGMMVVRSGDATMGRWGLASAGNGPVRGRDSVPQA